MVDVSGKYEVVIVGAGPSGLCMGLALSKLGVSNCIIEKRSANNSNYTRAFSLHSRTLEQLAILNCAKEMISRGVITPKIPLLWGIDVDFTSIDSEYNFMLTIPQSSVEDVLRKKYLENKGNIFYNTEYVSYFDLEDDNIRVQANNNNKSVALKSKYLIAADGVHSKVRETTGITFNGRTAITDVLIADIKFKESPVIRDLLLEANKDGFVFISPFGDGYFRVLGWNKQICHNVNKESSEVLSDKINLLLNLVLHKSFDFEDVQWISTFSSKECIAQNYKFGNVFLIGDSAHTHSPAGGMGLNLGIQDAINLAWKIAGTLQGTLDKGILETYENEMQVLAESVIKNSGNLIREATSRGSLKSKIVDSGMNKLSRIQLINKYISRRVALNISGNNFRMVPRKNAISAKFSKDYLASNKYYRNEKLVFNIDDIRPDGYTADKEIKEFII